MSIAAAQPMMANWRATVQLVTSWSTDVVVARSIAEERRTLIDRPYRTMNATLSGMTQEDTVQLVQNMMLAQDARARVPLYCDHSRVTQDSSGTTLHCDTRFRRFFAGAIVMVHGWTRSRPSGAQYATVKRVYDDRLELVAAITGTVVEGCRVFPCVDAEVSLDASAKVLTDQRTETTISATEVVGPSALPASVHGLPPGMDTYQGYAVLDLQTNYASEAETSAVRAGRAYQQGRGRVVFTQGPRPQSAHVLHLTGMDRERSFRIVQFFDAVRGRARPFWLVTPETVFSLAAVSTDYVDVDALGLAASVASYVDHVAVVMRDGTVYVREVSGVADNGTTFRVSLVDALPALSAGDVRRVTTARFCRLRDDSITEQWETDGTCQVELPLVEVLLEDDVVIDVSEPSTFSAPPETIADLVFWFDAAHGAWFSETGASTPVRTRLADPWPSPFAEVTVWDDVRNLPFPYAVSNTSGHQLITFADGDQGVSRRTFEISHDCAMYVKMQSVVPWDVTKGFTLFVSGRTSSRSGSQPILFLVKKVGGLATMLEWREDELRVYQAPYTSGSYDSRLWVRGLDSVNTGDKRVLMVTWKPSQYTRVYYDGVLQGEAEVAADYLPTDATDDFTELLSVDDGVTYAGTVGKEKAVGDKWFVDGAVCFERALDVDELNAVGEHLAALQGSEWTTIT